MERRPQRYGTPQLKGYKAYKAWAPLGVTLRNAEAAQKHCEQHAGRRLTWEVSVQTPSGNPLWVGSPREEAKAGEQYQASPDEAPVREHIPGAEFVSQDPACRYYIEPNGHKWDVCSMVDMEGRDSFEVMMMTGGSCVQEGADAAKLWNFFVKTFDEKASALSYGRYLWGRTLVRQNAPPAAIAGKLRERVRGWAVRWL